MGLLRFPGAFLAESASALLEILWSDYAARHGVSHADPAGWLTARGEEVRLYGPPPPCMTSSAHYAEVLDRLGEAADGLFGTGTWELRPSKTTLFVNCPNPARRWAVPSGWHTDLPVDPSSPSMKFVYAFAFLDDVLPRGGATLLLANSASRMRLESQAVVRGGKKLKARWAQESSWFADLFNEDAPWRAEGAAAAEEAAARRLMEEGTSSRGVRLRVVELTGAPGDLLLWDPRAFHSASGNIRERPRSLIRFRLDLR